MFLLINTLLFACSEKDQDTGSEDTASEDTASNDSGEDLGFAGLAFILTSSQGYEPVSELISLSFASNEAFGFSGDCNSFSGDFEVDGDVFSANSLFGTEMACANELMAEDEWLVSFFTGDPTFSFQEDSLIFQSDDVTLTFTDRETVIPDLPLVDTVWEIDSYIDGSTAMAVFLDTVPSVTFLSDGSIDLNTGCNSGMGQYTLEEDSLSVTIDAYTDAICEDPDVNTAEAHIVSVFQGPTLTVSLNESRLTLMNGEKGISAVAQQ